MPQSSEELKGAGHAIGIGLLMIVIGFGVATMVERGKVGGVKAQTGLRRTK